MPPVPVPYLKLTEITEVRTQKKMREDELTEETGRKKGERKGRKEGQTEVRNVKEKE